MITYLSSHHPEWTDHLISEDFMKLDLPLVRGSILPAGRKLSPTSPSQIVIRMIEHRDLIPELVGMFPAGSGQTDRLPAPGNKDYGSSVS